MAGYLVKFETIPKYSSASNPAERAIEAVEEQSRTIRADYQMRFGNDTLGADIPVAFKQAYGEHYTHEVVPFAEGVLVKVLQPCSSRVFGLVEMRRLTNTSFSRLEVACLRERFDDWNHLVDTMMD